MHKKLINLTVNGDTHELAVAPNETLLDVLRNDLGMTGTKRGCTAGSCGVCTVNGEVGEAICSCLTLAIEWDGRSVTTIEGVQDGAELHPLQQAFLDYGAVQCGFCTPGLIMTAKALLDVNTDPTEDEINEALAGAICRCTGHIKVKKAVRRAAEMLREREAATS
ncbi:MAG: (2Fe-2S)-binding protein [Gammaproteobacteria bacterium]|nr:(2Fe-2S)-binding protein [Gammaproteobacteria bacterium]MBT8445194.1 (2Fe-2S)-binding protein [Gammaproteobacteria bacterium]NND37172.1 (2Fe-2S)-binding protein [Gammaproteobacteria bacterium]